MSLRAKTLLTVGLLFPVLVAIVSISSRAILLDRFSQMDRQQTEEQLARASAVIADEVNTIGLITKDWSVWDDAYAFVETRDPKFIESNLAPPALGMLKLNMMLFLDPAGHVIYSQAFDYDVSTVRPLPPDLMQHLTPGSLLLRHPSTTNVAKGLLMLPEGPLMVVSRPIVRSNGQGPIRGTLICGRYLDHDEIERIALLTRQEVHLYPWSAPELKDDIKAALLQGQGANALLVRPRDEKTIDGYTLETDIYGQPALAVGVQAPRLSYMEGLDSVGYSQRLILLAVLFMGVVVLLALERMILAPVARLHADLNAVAASADPSVRVRLSGSDELGRLADTVNQTLQTLERSQEQVREAEARYHSLFANMLDAFAYYQVISDEQCQPVDYLFLEVNDAFEQITGRSAEHVVGKRITEVLAGGPTDLMARYCQVALTGEAARFDRYVPALQAWHRVGVYSPKPGFIATVFADITQRKQAEAALREREGVLSTILDTLPAGVLIVGRDKVIRQSNRAAREMIGLPEGEDVVGQICHCHVCPAEVGQCPVFDRGQTVDNAERVLLKSDGTRLPVLKTVVPITLQGEDLLLEAFVDISARIEAEARQAATIEGLQAIVDGAERLIACADQDCLFREAVEFARSRLGLERCAILTTEAHGFRGTFGTNMQGQTTDEHAMGFPMNPVWQDRCERVCAGALRWLSAEETLAEWDGRQSQPVREGWVALTPIQVHAGDHPLAVFVNDTAISGAPMDEAKQEVLAVFCSLLANIAVHKQAEVVLRAYADATSAVAYAADVFLRVGSDENSIPDVLEHLGRATGCNRVYVFENETSEDGERRTSERHEWVADGIEPQIDNPGLQHLPYSRSGFGRWEAELSAGQPVYGYVRDFPECERKFLQEQGVVSLAVVPVFVDQEWWGFIGFDECRREREWTAVEVDALAVAAGLFGASTQHREAEQALWQSQETYRLLAENVSDIVWQTDAEGNFTYMSPAVREFGYEPEELLGWHFTDILRPEDQGRFLELFVQDLESPAAHRYELRARAKDGSWFWLDVSVSYQVEDGIAVAMQGIARNIHERKLAEARLERLMSDLARSNTELEQFAYVASHDLQEPLRMVASYVQLLERRYQGKLDQDANEFIGFAVDGANRMQRLINDLLAYSRVGTQGKAFQPVPMAGALHAALSNLQVAVTESAAEVTQAELPTVTGDESQLVQLLQNLVANAIKFHGEAPPRIHLTAEQGKGEWLFRVQDNGIGIDPRYAARIFVIFQRLHTRQQYAGTGIGLALCKRIVDRHRGRIWVESTPGQGSAFCFTIPEIGDDSE